MHNKDTDQRETFATELQQLLGRKWCVEVTDDRHLRVREVGAFTARTVLRVVLGSFPETEQRRQVELVASAAVIALKRNAPTTTLQLPLSYFPSKEQESSIDTLNRLLSLDTPETEKRFQYLVRRAKEEAERMNQWIRSDRWRKDLVPSSWKPAYEVRVSGQVGGRVKVVHSDPDTKRKITERFKYTEEDLDGKTLEELESEVQKLVRLASPRRL